MYKHYRIPDMLLRCPDSRKADLMSVLVSASGVVISPGDPRWRTGMAAWFLLQNSANCPARDPGRTVSPACRYPEQNPAVEPR